MKWWVLRLVARWCGLTPGVVGRHLLLDDVPCFVVFTRDDKQTLEVLLLIAQTFNPAPGGDARVHREWVN